VDLTLYVVCHAPLRQEPELEDKSLNSQETNSDIMSNLDPTAPIPGAAADKPLSDAAKRALQEAAERRAEIDARASEIAREPERLGRGGLEPVRYNDWEIKGITSDF